MSQNLYTAQFNFQTPEWTGIKTAIFTQNNVTKFMILDENNQCVVPWEFFFNRNKTYGYVSVFCGSLITANRAIVEIEKSGYNYCIAHTDPTPDIYQQIVTLLAQKGDALELQGNTLLLLSSGQQISSVMLPDPDPEQIQAAVNAYLEENPVSADIPIVNATETTLSIEPGKMYAFGEVASLDISLTEPTNPDVVNEYMFSFISGETATQLSVPADVKGVPAIEPNSIYQCSIVDNCFAYGRWDNNVTV